MYRTGNYYMFLMNDEEAIIGPSDWVMVKAQRLLDKDPHGLLGWVDEQFEYNAKMHAVSCEADNVILHMTNQEVAELSYAELTYEMEGAFGFDV
jgi:hypothetical protein